MLKKFLTLLAAVVTICLLTACSELKEYSKQVQEEQAKQTEIVEMYLPENYTADEINMNDDFIQIITDNTYSEENIPDLYAFLESKKNDQLIADYDIQTYQRGSKYSDDFIVVIIHTIKEGYLP